MSHKPTVTTTITTVVDADQSQYEHSVEVIADSGLPEEYVKLVVVNGLQTLLTDFDASTREPDTDAEPIVVVHKNLEVGEQVYLDEDIYDDPPVHSPARVYLFEQYDSDAPTDSNCTLVDVETRDWTVRGVGELVPVDDLDSKIG